jgi:hypothetical protein
MERPTGQEETMIAKSTRALILGAAAVAMTCFAASAEPMNQRYSLSGTYVLANLNVGETSVSMDFTATITNNGPKDVKGKIVLNDPSVIQKIFTQFGDQSIRAGGNVKINSNVTVPREEYDAWLTRGPNVTFYAQNDRGEMKTFRISMSGKPTAAAK